MTAPALDLALIEFGRAYSNLRRHFYARRAGHRIPGVTRAECDKCVRTAARYRAAWAVVADLGGAVVVCGNAGCGRALVVRVGGRKRLEAFADRRGWALSPQWTSTLCPDHWRTS